MRQLHRLLAATTPLFGFLQLRKRRCLLMNTTDPGGATALCLSLTKSVNHATDELDTLQEIVQPNVFVRTMRIRSGITVPKLKQPASAEYRDSAHRSHRTARWVHRIDDRCDAIDLQERIPWLLVPLRDFADDLANGALPSSIISISLKPRTSRCFRNSVRTICGVRSGTSRKSRRAIAVLGNTVLAPASV